MMKRVFVTTPMMLPRLSDKAAAQVLDILSELLGAAHHHYGSQARRWQRQQQRRHPTAAPRSSPLPDHDDPF